MIQVTLPPLSAQGAYLIRHQALLLRDGGMRNVPLPLCHHRTTGCSHLHQTIGEFQSETQALHSICMFLLNSDKGRQRGRGWRFTEDTNIV